MRGNSLITGADGYLGGKLTTKYLASGNDPLVLWVRAKDDEEAALKRRELEHRFGSSSDRWTMIVGDLRQDEPFAEVDVSSIRGIIHTAAVTRFNVERDLAEQVNRDGTRRVLEFADRCPNLTRYAQVSTVYSSGLAAGNVPEEPVSNEHGFANHYERSKFDAERILLTEYGHLPWQIFRAATIFSDDDRGTVVQYNVFHNTLRLFFHGLISLLPGLQETPLYFVTARFTGECIYYLLHQPETVHRIYNVCHSKRQALPLGELIDRVFKNFDDDPEFRKRRVLPPLFTDMDAFDTLADTLTGLTGAMVRQALDSIRPFSKQLFIAKDISNERLRADYPEYQYPDMGPLTDRIVQHLVQTRWGRLSDA